MTEPRVKRPRKVYLEPRALKQARRWVGLTQAELGRRVGVVQQQIAAWEAEPRKPEHEEYYGGPKHRGMSRAVVEMLERALVEYAQARSIDTEPLKKLFSPE